MKLIFFVISEGERDRLFTLFNPDAMAEQSACAILKNHGVFVHLDASKTHRSAERERERVVGERARAGASENRRHSETPSSDRTPAYREGRQKLRN